MKTLNKVSQPDGRRRVECRDVVPNHGQVVGLLTTFENVIKMFRNPKSENYDNFHDS